MTTATVTTQSRVPAGRHVPAIEPAKIIAIARKEVRDALRNRWFILYTLAFAMLALGLAFVATAGTGETGLAGFGRTAASLINLVILIVPLMALTIGTGALTVERERGMLRYLLAQPVSRFEVFIGKYIGLALGLAGSLCLGFGACAAVMAWRGGGAEVGSFITLVGLALLLSLGMLSVGFLVSALSRQSSAAFGTAIFVWLMLVFLGDLGLMGSAVAFKLQVTELFRLALLNPLQVFKMASLDSLHASLDVLGPVGFYATQTYGANLMVMFLAALSAWVVIPGALALFIFSRRGVS